MDAWIDCLTYADEDDGMRAVVVPPGEVLIVVPGPPRLLIEAVAGEGLPESADMPVLKWQLPDGGCDRLGVVAEGPIDQLRHSLA